MKQKLIAMLKTLFASKGFNAKELEGMADIIITQHNLNDDSTDEDLSAAAEAQKPYADFVQSVASRQVTDAKKPKPVDPKPEDTPTPDPQPNPNDPNSAVLEMLKEMKGELAALKGEKVTNSRKERIDKILANSDDKFKAAQLKAFGRMKFDSDEEFDTYLTELEEDAKGFVKVDEGEQAFNGFRPGGGTGGATPESKKVAPAVVSFIAKQAEARKTAAGSESQQK